MKTKSKIKETRSIHNKPVWEQFGFQTFQEWLNSNCILLQMPDKSWFCTEHDVNCKHIKNSNK